MCCAQQVSSASLLLGALNHRRSSEDGKHADRGLTMLTPAVDISSGVRDARLKGSKPKKRKETIYVHRWKILFIA